MTRPEAGVGDGTRSIVEAVYRRESRRVLATLARLLGDIDLAEDALQTAFRAALEQWPDAGVPGNPYAWLVSTGRFKAIDRLRRRAMFKPVSEAELAAATSTMPVTLNEVDDDQLRMVFICCHPDLPMEGRLALTLREVCGLTTDEIGAAFLVPRPTIAQRIVRAKRRIRERRIPLELPAMPRLRPRLDSVLRVVYLVYNEGYSASSGERVMRVDLSGEAIRLARLVSDLVDDPEARGLLALLLLQNARGSARTTRDGDIVPLEEQDRSRWDSAQIVAGLEALTAALGGATPGRYTLQAAIAAEHVTAPTVGETDWSNVIALYDSLLVLEPSPVVELNRAVAVAMRDGPARGIHLVRSILERGELTRFHRAHATLGELHRRNGATAASVDAYRTALALAVQLPERRFIRRQLEALTGNEEDR